MTTRRQITLELDEMDYAAVQKAMARRQTFRAADEDGVMRPVLPEHDSNLAGVLLAEICRGWLQLLDRTMAHE